MADSASEIESDASSIDGGPTTCKYGSTNHVEHLKKRIDTLEQENRVLKMELETFKLKCKALQEETKELRQISVTIQARAEQEEEFISNTLMKKIQSLKKEKETLAVNYEHEEEFLTNELSRKLMQLRQEKVQLEQTLEQEQEYQVNKLMRKIQKLENETTSKQTTLEQLRREKIELENSLEQEQEALVNRLWKRMDKLEAEKRILQEKLDQPISAPASPHDIFQGDRASSLTKHIENLRKEVGTLRQQLSKNEEIISGYIREERVMREENLRLHRKLQMEVERRESLCRHLSESESSLEMDDERHFNEMSKHHDVNMASLSSRPRTISSPIPLVSPSQSLTGLIHSGGSGGLGALSPNRRSMPISGNPGVSMSNSAPLGSSPPVFQQQSLCQRPRHLSGEKFAKPISPEVSEMTSKDGT